MALRHSEAIWDHQGPAPMKLRVRIQPKLSEHVCHYKTASSPAPCQTLEERMDAKAPQSHFEERAQKGTPGQSASEGNHPKVPQQSTPLASKAKALSLSLSSGL